MRLRALALDERVWTWTRHYGPFAVAVCLLLWGYVRFSSGIDQATTPDAYRDATFPAFRYSDVIWLYLRDNLANQPVPYLDFPLEYPVLTGALTYVLSFAQDIDTYFALAYLVSAGSVMITIAALRASPAANPWLYAAAPALVVHPGYQLDAVAIAPLAVALVLYRHRRDRWGTLALSTAVWLKLFPIAFLPAVLIQRARERRYRDAAEIVALFAAISVAVNLPVAWANPSGWYTFFRWSRERPADSGIWVLFDRWETPTATLLSLVLIGVGWALLSWLWLRFAPPGPPAAGAGFVPLGAALLLWWLLANKAFTGHLMLWVFFAAALLSLPLWLWVALAAVDLGNAQAGALVNLVGTVRSYQNAPVLVATREHLIYPLHVARSLLMLIGVGIILLRQFVVVPGGPLARRDVEADPGR